MAAAHPPPPVPSCSQVTFPDDATREDRALLLAAAILADYVFFEKGNNNKGKAGVADGIAQPLLA